MVIIIGISFVIGMFLFDIHMCGYEQSLIGSFFSKFKTIEVTKSQEVFMYNTGSLKVNGNKVVRTIKFKDIPNNTYVIVDENKNGANKGDLVLKDVNGYYVNLMTGRVSSCDDTFGNRLVVFADVELNFTPVKEE